MGLFGSDTPGAPSLLDYVGSFLFAHELPSYVNNEFQQRAAAQAQAQQQNALKSYLYNDAFGSDFGGGLPKYRGSTALTQQYGGAPGATAQSGAAIAASQPAQAGAYGSAPVAGIASMGTPANGGGIPTTAPRTNSTAYTGDDGNILYNADGSPRSYQQLQNDRRFIGLQMDPAAAGMLKAWSDAAQARAPKWDFHNDQYFNTNADDPTAGSRRVGTGMDNTTGIYTSVDPATGQVVAHSAQGFNPMIADVTGAKQRATSDATNASELQYAPQIDRAKAYATIDPAIALRQQQLEQDAGIGARAAGAKAAAEAAGKAPYTPYTFQGPNGPVNTTTSNYLGQVGAAGNPGIIGRDAGQLNAIRTDNEADNTDIRAYNATNNNIQNNLDLLKKGGLQLNPIQNAWHGLEAKTGLGNMIGDPQAANYNNFQSSIQDIVNKSLLLNKGTQTEGDAQRAAKAILSNINDQSVVEARLQQIQQLNEKAIAERQAAIRQRNAGYVVQPGPANPSYTADQLAAEAARRRAQGGY